MTISMPDFRIERPRRLADAFAARREHADAKFIGGGTDLLVNIRHGLDKPALLIDLSEIAELSGIELGADGLRIGAGVSLAEVASLPAITQRYRALAQAAAAVAGPGHRKMGTVGGNLCLDTRCIYYNQSQWWRQANGFCLKRGGDVCRVAPQGKRCHAAYSGDLAPALLAFAADVEVAGPRGRRRIPLSELFIEDGRAHLSLAADEIVLAVHVPSDPPPSSYAKVRVRDALDFPLAGVAVALAMSGSVVKTLRIGLTGTNSRPFLVADIESLLGKPIDESALQHIERIVQKQVQPMRTTIASAHYRRLAAAASARRLVYELSGPAA